jgi:hypothetical protein
MQDTRLIGKIHALYYSDLFPAIGVQHPTRRDYRPFSLAIGFKDLDPEEIQSLESTLQHYFCEGIPESVSVPVPGLYRRTNFTRNETDHKTDTVDYQYPFRPDAVITAALLDVWLQTENAGQCGYIAGSSNFHNEIERWSPPSSPNNHHATLYVQSKLQSRMYDRSPEWRRKMVAFIDGLPKTMSDEDARREIVKRDTPHIQTVYLLREKDSTFLIGNFLPGYRILSPKGYPELVLELE